jgi:hypothetical protein
MMDPTALIKSWAEAGSAALSFVTDAVALLPSGKNREEAQRLLVEAEREHKQAQAGLARKLGFELCEYCWPPEIVLVSPATRRLECRHCHRPPLRVEREERDNQIWRSKQLNEDDLTPRRS